MRKDGDVSWGLIRFHDRKGRHVVHKQRSMVKIRSIRWRGIYVVRTGAVFSLQAEAFLAGKVCT